MVTIGLKTYGIVTYGDKVDGMFVMDSKKPYVELRLGIHNIFKLVHVEYVRRLTYMELPTAKRDGFRIIMRMTF